jgi:hypothetical protein
VLNEKGEITEGEIAESALAEYEHGADAADDVALEVWKEFGKWCSLRCSRSQCGRFCGEVLASRLWQESRCCAENHYSLIWVLV